MPNCRRAAASLTRLAAPYALLLLAAHLGHGDAHAQAGASPGRTRVVVLGSGTPAADPERFGPAVVVLVDSSAYLFDIGVGVVRRWAAALERGVTASDATALRVAFVTHLHSDHTLGYPELIFTSWTLDPAGRPLAVYGPRGLAGMTANILQAYKEDVAIRIGPGGEKAGGTRPVVEVHEIEPGVVHSDSLVRVTAFAVRHGTWPQAFGYRIRTPDKVIVLSGDATAGPEVARQCRGCDLLLHEGGFVGDAGARAYFREFHTTAEELARIATEAKPGLLVLYHQRPAGKSADAGYRTLRAHYQGPFVVARDLDVFY